MGGWRVETKSGGRMGGNDWSHVRLKCKKKKKKKKRNPDSGALKKKKKKKKKKKTATPEPFLGPPWTLVDQK